MTVKRVRFLQDLIHFLGLQERLHLEWISSAEAQKFAQVAIDFTEKIRALGPNPLTDFQTKTRSFGLGTAPKDRNAIKAPAAEGFSVKNPATDGA